MFARQISHLYKHAVGQLKDAANGMSDSEKSSARAKIFNNFILSLLPFHDLVKNIIEGNKHDAAVSGVFDFIGLFNPAAKGGFKAASVGAKGVSSALTFLKGAAKSGLKAANPLEAVYDVGSGLFKLGKTALNAGALSPCPRLRINFASLGVVGASLTVVPNRASPKALIGGQVKGVATRPSLRGNKATTGTP
ncbi:hypothetical protein K2E96_07500 [Pseudomonas sp. ERGC3:05]|nr:hypothetical protein K2E96_07500 [Pseudomonas sp. ERGC3:05]